MTSMPFVFRSIWLLPMMLIVSVLYFAVVLCAIVIGFTRELVIAGPGAAFARLHHSRDAIGIRRIRV